MTGSCNTVLQSSICGMHFFINTQSRHFLDSHSSSDSFQSPTATQCHYSDFPPCSLANFTFSFILPPTTPVRLIVLKLYFLLSSVDCGGGQEEWPCGKPCPRSCSDLHGDTECLDSPGCRQTCGCPGDMVLQDGVCVAREECRCKYHNSSATG